MIPEKIKKFDLVTIKKKCGGNYANKTMSKMYLYFEYL